MKKITLAEVNVGDQFSTKSLKPRLLRVAIVTAGSMLGHSAHLDTEGWWYLTVPSVLLGMIVEILGSMLTGGASKKT